LTRLARVRATPYAFLAAAVIFLAVTILYPFLDTVRLSLFQENAARPDLGRDFVGLGNFADVLGSDSFWSTLLRTLAWTGLSVSAKLLLGLITALLLYRPFRGRRIYQALLFVPWITPGVVAAITWKWIYNGQVGILNYVLDSLHVISEPRSWLGDELSAFLAVVVVDIWAGVPLMTLLLIAGLQAIPDELLDASRVDGATSWTQTRYVILPQLRPVIAIASVLSIIWTFNAFQIIWPMTRGGPVGATETLVVRTYRELFGEFNIGLGATYAVISLAILLVTSLIYMRLVRGRET
jgi:multiple sugar transport system permease protein